MRIFVFDADADLGDSLAALLARRGHEVVRQLDDHAPDLVIVGLPAPCELSPDALPRAPLLLLLGPQLRIGELERWIGAAERWSIASKPVRESAIDTAIARITRPHRPPAYDDPQPLRIE